MDTASLRYLCTLYRVGVVGDLTDGQLLERFVAGRDESAEAGFAALVERHGPMVLRVCRQILGDAHDAEDAFQATFLVLARRAGSVRKRESVASWLYGIAQRVARRSQADSARRREHERRRVAMTTMESSDDTDRHPSEDWPELHEEVDRLPEKYREAIVLCYLEGLTTEAAARRLACAQGTIMSRLSRGRERLRQRLTRRGLAPAVGLLTAGLSADGAKAAVPAALAHSLVQAAMQMAAGTTAAGGVPATVAALTEGVLRMMVRSRLRGIVGAVLAVGALAAGTGMFVYRTAGARPQDAPAGKTAKAALSASRKDDPSRTAKGSAGELVVRAADLSRKGGEEPFIGIVAIDPADGEVADDLYGARHRRWPRLSRTAATWSRRSSAGTSTRKRPASGSMISRARRLLGGSSRRRASLSGRTTAGRSSSVCRSARGIGSSRPGASMPMARAGPGCRSPMATSSSIAPATGRGSRRGPSAANPTHQGTAHPGSPRRDRRPVPDRRVGER